MIQFNAKKERAPVNQNGSSPCPPFNCKERCEVARCVFHAVRAAGASVAVQLVAGDAAYCGKSRMEIEFVIANAGGTQEQSRAAVLALGSTKFKVIPVGSGWWPLGDGRYDELDIYVKNSNHTASLKQH